MFYQISLSATNFSNKMKTGYMTKFEKLQYIKQYTISKSNSFCFITNSCFSNAVLTEAFRWTCNPYQSSYSLKYAYLLQFTV